LEHKENTFQSKAFWPGTLKPVFFNLLREEEEKSFKCHETRPRSSQKTYQNIFSSLVHGLDGIMRHKKYFVLFYCFSVCFWLSRPASAVVSVFFLLSSRLLTMIR
jgi:hypothetical protein